MAPPAIRPLENSTPGPDSSSAIDCCRAWARRSMSQRTTPPTNMADEVEIGRYTPTATGSACTPISSIAIELMGGQRSEEHTAELQSRPHVVCRPLLAKKKNARVRG